MALMTITMAGPFLCLQNIVLKELIFFFLRTRNVDRQIENGGKNEPKEEAHSRAFVFEKEEIMLMSSSQVSD